MTSSEFQVKYDKYRTPDRNKAILDSMKLKLSDGVPVVTVQIGSEYCLMLKPAAEMVADLGLANIISLADMINEAGQ